MDGRSGDAPRLPSGELGAALLHDIVARTGEVAYRYRLLPEPGFEYVSESVAALVGYTAAECYADPLIADKLVYREDADLLPKVLEASAGAEQDILIRWVHRDGRVVWTEQRYILTRDATGKPLRVDGIVHDVTRREEERQQRLQLIQFRGQVRELGETERRVRVLIADDHELTRAGLRAILTMDPRLELVGEADNGLQAVELATALQPDLVLMDMRMPHMDGLSATRALKQTCPMTTVLILSMFEDVDLLLEAVKAGAAGYVLKASTEQEVVSALWEALDGNLPVDQGMAREVLRRLAQQQAPAPTAPSRTRLSPREQEVLDRLARGLTNREIAEELIITSNTVKIHVEHILAKLGVSDRTQAAVRAIELGYVKPDRLR